MPLFSYSAPDSITKNLRQAIAEQLKNADKENETRLAELKSLEEKNQIILNDIKEEGKNDDYLALISSLISGLAVAGVTVSFGQRAFKKERLSSVRKEQLDSLVNHVIEIDELLDEMALIRPSIKSVPEKRNAVLKMKFLLNKIELMIEPNNKLHDDFFSHLQTTAIDVMKMMDNADTSFDAIFSESRKKYFEQIKEIRSIELKKIADGI